MITAHANEPDGGLTRCGWFSEETGGRCGERAVIAVLVQTYEPYPPHVEKRAGLMLCERHNFPAREVG